MSYNYKIERPKLFTEEGQVLFLKIRDRAHELLKIAGAFRQGEVLKGISGDNWTMMACLDRMIELGELEELDRDCWAQFTVYSTPQKHNL